MIKHQESEIVNGRLSQSIDPNSHSAGINLFIILDLIFIFKVRPSIT